jgi:methylglutamate dehydrogenase subunit C
MSGYRLPAGGTLIDRDQPITFRFDGRRMSGYAGDTLASALLAGGTRIVARSFKYHRPRGIFSCGPEEPNALVTIGEGARSTPNTKATVTELHDGLVAASQNRWPSLRFDLMAATGLFAPVLSAGFYYKTFMGPTRGAWHLYERFIRRAAGLGRPAGQPDPDHYGTSHLFCDVLVVGGGASGLSAALAAARCGARVVLCDDGGEPGGSLFSQARTIDGVPAHDWARATVQALSAFPDVRVMPRTTVWGYYDGNVLAALERVTDHLAQKPAHLPREHHWTIQATEVVLATGATEWPILFGGNDLPGVMLAGAVHRYAQGYGVAAGRRVVLFGGHDGLYETALELAGAGVGIAAVVDPRKSPPDDLATDCRDAGIAVHAASAVVRASGRGRVRAVEIASLDAPDRTERIVADTCATSGGWMPSIQLHSQAGGRPVYDCDSGMFLPGAPRERWRSAGACRGVMALPDCLADGAAAGRDAAAAAGFVADDAAPPATEQTRQARPPLVFRESPGAGRGRAKTFVDLQNDVTLSDIQLAHREGFRTAEHVKRYTTLGMGTDQGRTSNLPALAVLAGLRGTGIAEVGTTSYRAPSVPVTLGALAGPRTGAHLRPVRRTPMHDRHIAAGAEMVAAGLWMRPRAYFLPDETLDDAYVREMRLVRERVGIADVSTLGKIDVQGPDAATFLDRIYVNTISTLPAGRARYGVMLRDDGFVFDDGTCWRLSQTRFLVTTTTANAGPVMQWLEFLLDTAWPELRVHLASVTDQWAGIAVSGPLSRAVLGRVIEGVDLMNDALPHMGVREAMMGDVPVMVARLSFSGELAYEVFAPAHHGVAVWDALLDEGAAPYGLEALGALRIEKGHIAGSEIDGRTTLSDLGLARMASSKKDFIGNAMMAREALAAPGRPALVGLVSQNGRPVRIGAQLVEDGPGMPPARSLGHVTATTWSPTLERYIALALLSDGRQRHGTRLIAADPVRGAQVPVDVRDAHFYDPEGKRLHV